MFFSSHHYSINESPAEHLISSHWVFQTDYLYLSLPGLKVSVVLSLEFFLITYLHLNVPEVSSGVVLKNKHLLNYDPRITVKILIHVFTHVFRGVLCLLLIKSALFWETTNGSPEGSNVLFYLQDALLWL